MQIYLYGHCMVTNGEKMQKTAVYVGLFTYGVGHEIWTHMRSDNSPEFITKELVKWFAKLRIITSFI